MGNIITISATDFVENNAPLSPPHLGGGSAGRGGGSAPPLGLSYEEDRRGGGADLLNTDYGRPGTLFHWENPDT